jgi:hypothetical protein
LTFWYQSVKIKETKEGKYMKKLLTATAMVFAAGYVGFTFIAHDSLKSNAQHLAVKMCDEIGIVSQKCVDNQAKTIINLGFTESQILEFSKRYDNGGSVNLQVEWKKGA